MRTVTVLVILTIVGFVLATDNKNDLFDDKFEGKTQPTGLPTSKPKLSSDEELLKKIKKYKKYGRMAVKGARKVLDHIEKWVAKDEDDVKKKIKT